jgi:threonine dehydrogenase-like Zn-dependent dehydrogenase
MKAAVLEKPGVLTVKNIPKRTCGKDEVLVKVRACGICGSDLKYFRGDNPWAMHTLGKNVENPPNMILGHEFAGEVVEIGDPSFEYLLGKRVFVEPYNTCGACEFCRTGRYNLCRNTRHIGHGAGWKNMDYFPGGMAEYCQVWATHVYEILGDISFEAATMLDPLAVAIHAVTVSAFRPGSEVLVLGTGPVGICIALAAKAFGAITTYCTDIYENVLSVAGKLGVNYPVNVKNTDIVEFVMQKTKGRGVDAVFDTVGTEESQHQALKLLAFSGTLVNLVANQNEVSYKLIELGGERCIKGSSNNLYEDLVLGIKLVSADKIDVTPLITHRFPLEEISKGFEVLFNKTETGAIKVVIIP